MLPVIRGVIYLLTVISAVVGLITGIPTCVTYARSLHWLGADWAHGDGDEAAEPVDELFGAWSTRDFSRYARQWDKTATQKAGGQDRDLGYILADKTAKFQALQQVTFIDYERCAYEPQNGKGASVFVSYAMNREYKAGTNRENETLKLTEVFRVRFDPFKRRWLITENHPYVTSTPPCVLKALNPS